MKQNLLVKQLLVIVFTFVGTMSVWGEEASVTLTNAQIKSAASGKGSYAVYTINNFTGRYLISSNSGTYFLQLGRNTDSSKSAYNSHIATPIVDGTITSITIVTNNSTASGRTFYICNSDSKGAPNEGDYGSGSISSAGGTANITVTGSPNQVYIYPNGTAYISSITVTYTAGSTKTSLSVPTNLSSSNVTSNGATLSWDAVANASSYTVKIGSTEYTNVNTNSYSATGLTASTEYTWTVKAIGDDVNYTNSDYAANANFTTDAPAVHRTVTWYVNGEEYTAGGPTTDVIDGNKVTALPTAPSVPGDCSGKVFVGWTNSKISAETDTKPGVLFTTAAGSPNVSGGDVKYYAVFADEN